MTRDETSEPEVSLEELAAMRAGELSEEEEARLRMRIEEDPNAKEKLWALDNVHRLFELPIRASGSAADLEDLDSQVASARLQARIAEEALRRAERGEAENEP